MVEFKKRLSSPANVQTCSGAHPVFYNVGNWAIPVGEGSKIGRGMMLTTYVHLVSRLSAVTTLHPYKPSWHAKIKFTLQQTTKAQRSSRDIPLLFLYYVC